ncbi:HET-domain-containing protein [Paramyrothecium foliicola]|nr:HET-domain-containing protein [Paramyrothecium foliicola]
MLESRYSFPLPPVRSPAVSSAAVSNTLVVARSGFGQDASALPMLGNWAVGQRETFCRRSRMFPRTITLTIVDPRSSKLAKAKTLADPSASNHWDGGWGENLYLCLKKLTAQQYKKWIWIDAICINQGDDAEKCHQIPLMREIYTRASEVLAWLGDANLLESSILDSNMRYAIQASMENPSPELQILRPGKRIAEFEDYLHIPMPLPLLIKGLTSIFDRPYFSRIWVQQEVILGKEVVVMYGDVKMNWEEFVTMTKACQWQGQPFTEHILNLKRTRDTAHSEAGDDDEMSLLADIYIQFTKWNLSLDRFQDMLTTLDAAYQFPDLPSWCPNLNWDGEAHIQWDIFSAGYDNAETRETTIGRSRPEPDEHPKTRWLDSRVLVLSAAFVVDEVQVVIPWHENIQGKDFQVHWSKLLKWDKACLRLTGKEDSEEQLLAHATTLVADRIWGIERSISPLAYHAEPIRCYDLWKSCSWLLSWGIPRLTLPSEFFD